MKKIALGLMVLFLAGGVAFAADQSAPEVLELKGTIVDSISADAHTQDLAEFVKINTKQRALDSAAGGYAILFDDGRVFKFDAQANAMIEEFLKKPESSLKVVVKVQQYTEQLTLISIKKQI